MLIPIIAGPTAVGKTDLSIQLAQALDAEIISADSRQIFREMSVGTAKPTPNELSVVKHHFVSELSLDQHYSAGIFQSQAFERIQEITARNRCVVVVGGSTLYLHALMFGLSDIPAVAPDVQQQTNNELAQYGSAWLHEQLRKVDPEGADRIDPTKSHRIARALSVHRSTGRPLASYFKATTPDKRFRLFMLHRERSGLYARINARVDLMVEGGLIEEVRNIIAAGFDLSAPPLQTIGYRELLAHLLRRVPLADSIELIKRNSRRYAKRQMTWFRKYDHAIVLRPDARSNKPRENTADTSIDELCELVVRTIDNDSITDA